MSLKTRLKQLEKAKESQQGTTQGKTPAVWLPSNNRGDDGLERGQFIEVLTGQVLSEAEYRLKFPELPRPGSQVN